MEEPGRPGEFGAVELPAMRLDFASRLLIGNRRGR